MIDILFAALLSGSCAYAWLAGGTEARWIAAMLLCAAMLSLPASWLDHSWRHTHLPVLGVDMLLLAGLAAIALRSRSYWPLWMTSFHLISVTTHAATVVQPQLRPIVYFALQAFWSLPLLLVMVLGIMLDRRARGSAGRWVRGRVHETRSAPVG